MRPIIAANWKMNPRSLREAKKILKQIRDLLVPIVGFEAYVAPPFPFIKSLYPLVRLTSIKLGAQNIHFENEGAFTGEVSLPMIEEWVDFVIIGHSERRAMGETNKIVNRKLHRVLDVGLRVILCIGESKEDYLKKDSEKIIEQLRSGLEGVNLKKVSEDLIIAYEPVWAIGTGIPADASYVEKNVFLIRQFISSLYTRETGAKVPVLYGGSVKAQNVKDFISRQGINGFLVGGASLDPGEFSAICQQAKELYKTKNK